MEDGLTRQDMDFLKERAQSFYKSASGLIKDKEFPLAAFSVEQAIQLRLKHFLGVKTGDFPRTHSIKSLVQECSDLCPAVKEFQESDKKIINLLGDIESAYIMSRYYPANYTETEVRNMLTVYEDLARMLDSCL